MGNEGIDLKLRQFGRMPDVLQQDTPLDPLARALFGLAAVASGSESVVEAIMEHGLAAGRRRGGGGDGPETRTGGQGQPRPGGTPSQVRSAIASRPHLASSIGRPGEVHWPGAYSRPGTAVKGRIGHRARGTGHGVTENYDRTDRPPAFRSACAPRAWGWFCTR